MTSRERFLDLMKRDILKLDLAELDFGIYRILNYRRSEIQRFFDEELPELLDKAMSHEGEARYLELENRLDELRADLEKAAAELGLGTAFVDDEPRLELATTPKGAAYVETREALARLSEGPVFAETEEDRLYNALYTFFSRYYRDGDFQPLQRRARGARYSVPYNGEDVHIHWRSKGSHYIKTTEELRAYYFRSGSWRVRFELVEAFQEPDNVKGNTRYFFPVPGECRTEVGGSGSLFVVPFAFRRLIADEEKRYGKKQDDLDGDTTQERIINDLAPSIEVPSGVTKQDLLYHLHRYARKNRTDYFVHPHLGAFLRDELDYYLKNEFLDIEGLTTTDAIADRLAKLRVLREVAGRIIDMLDEIESFQARLFLKRKFVLSNSYLVPIRLVPEELWDEVIANDVQLQRWREDFALKAKVTRRTLETHPTLVVATALFGSNFQSRLLASFDDIDAITDGILVDSENFGALRTLTPVIRERTGLVYLDPPYNTGFDGFIYKDEFSRHSTWLAMMSDRISMLRSCLNLEGTLWVSIDENEVANLRALMETVFGHENFVMDVVWQARKSVSSDALISLSHHHTLVAARDRRSLESNRADFRLMPQLEGFSNPDNDPNGPWVLDPMDAPNIRPNLTYPITNPVTGQEHWPPEGRCWRFEKDQVARLLEQGRIVFGRSGTARPQYKRYLFEAEEKGKTASSLWNDLPTTTDGTKLLQAMFGRKDVFSNPKPPGLIQRMIELASPNSALVVDVFAGSGSTGEAVIRTSRSDGFARSFLMVEMGEYFESVLQRRITKVMYAPEWKDGAPKTEPKYPTDPPEWVARSPRLVQVIKLETYEDSLNSLTIDQDGLLASEKMIRYVIADSLENSASLLVTERLEEPFDYQLEVHTEEGVQIVDVDLVTTFNLMKGIRPRRYRELENAGRRYVLIEGSEGSETVLVVWRRMAGLDPEAERVFLAEAVQEALGNTLRDYARLYHNADSALPNSVSLDAEFKRLMFEPEPALT